MKKDQTLIFVVDDDPTFNKLMYSFLISQNVGTIKSFLSGKDCLQKIHEQPDIILLDYTMPGKNGLEMMQEIKKLSPKTGCIFLSGQNDVNVGVEAIKEGAFDYIVKDDNAKDIALNKINELLRLKAEKDNKSESFFYFG